MFSAIISVSCSTKQKYMDGRPRETCMSGDKTGAGAVPETRLDIRFPHGIRSRLFPFAKTETNHFLLLAASPFTLLQVPDRLEGNLAPGLHRPPHPLIPVFRNQIATHPAVWAKLEPAAENPLPDILVIPRIGGDGTAEDHIPPSMTTGASGVPTPLERTRSGSHCWHFPY